MADTPDERPEPFDPFANLPMFGEIAKALAGQGPINWDAARQFALLGATGGQSEPNVDPVVRVAYQDLARLVWFHVAEVLGQDGDPPSFGVVTRSEWSRDTLEAYRHLFTELAAALGPTGADDADGAGDPMMAMMAGLSKMMAPAMLGMGVGSMVGRLSARAFGTHDLPIPRRPATIALVPANVDEFAREWEIPTDEMRLWVLAHEFAGHVLLASPAIDHTLSRLVREHVGGFRPDPGAVADRLGALDAGEGGGDPMAALQAALGDPEVVLGAVTSPEQEALRPQLDALVAALVGATDWVVDAVAVRLVGGNALRIAEAVRRRRNETSSNDRFIEQLLGIRLGDGQVARGKHFVQGVVDRAGERGLDPLLSREDAAPTPAELDAPGLWLARLESPATDH